MVDPIRIEPNAWYDDGALRLNLQITSATLANARRSGALRHTRRGTRVFYRGSWVCDWLDGAPRQTPERREAAHA